MKKITVALWRRFEKIVSLAIKSILEDGNIEEIQEKLTEPTHDGGYDGSFLIPYITDSGCSTTQGYYKILFEAKLRTNLDKDLPLQDFSKSLIIAINVDSDALIVATNLRLSDGTKEHLRDFSEKTGLKTYYLSPHYVDTWMSEHHSLIHASEDKQIRELLKNSSLYSSIYPPLELLERVVATPQQELQTLVGQGRNHLLMTMIHALEQSSGSVIIKGDAGVGKSFFCSHLTAKLKKKNYIVYSIDMKNYQTPRVLFLKLLEALWHIPFEALMSLGQTGLHAIVNEFDSEIADDHIKEAILSAFSRDLEHYSQQTDILNYYMIKYLLTIHRIRSRHANIILYFSNINYLSVQMVDFVLQFLNEYTKQGKVILELRTSTYIDMHMDSDEWTTYLKQFVSMESVLYQESLLPFSHIEACEYISQMLPDYAGDTLLTNSILRVTGYNPLFVESLVEYLIFGDLLQTLPRESILNRIDHLIVDDKRQLISLLINAFCRKDFFFAEFFELLHIFQIPISEIYIEQLLSDYQTMYVDQLIEAKLICRVAGNLEVVHPLQLECILNNHSLMDSTKQELAKKILKTVDTIILSAEVLAMIRIRCYRILYDYQQVIEIEYPLAIGLMENGQYTLCYEYALDAFQIIEKLDYDYQMFIHLKILLLMVEICIYQGEECVLEIDKYMEKLKHVMDCFVPNHQEYNDYIFCKAQYYMTKNRYAHYMGKFDQAFDTLCEALVFADKYAEKLGNQVIGNIQLEYAIALKEKEDLKQSTEYLKECLKIQPNNPEILFTYHTQMYEMNLLTNPELSLMHIEENRSLYEHLHVSTTIHNEVHWLNTQYYMKNYDICFSQANKTFKKTEQIGLKNESGCLANLIGNIYFLKGDFHNAQVYYHYGIELFKGKGYVSNVWEILVNMSSLLAEQRNTEAITFIRLSMNILTNSYRERIQKPYPLLGYYEKLQVAVLILYYNIKKLEYAISTDELNQLLDELSEKLLNENMKTWMFALSCKDIVSLMKETRHYHSKYLLLGN